MSYRPALIFSRTYIVAFCVLGVAITCPGWQECRCRDGNVGIAAKWQKAVLVVGIASEGRADLAMPRGVEINGFIWRSASLQCSGRATASGQYSQ